MHFTIVERVKYNVHYCMVYIIHDGHCTVYSDRCTMYTVHCTTCSRLIVWRTVVQVVHFKMYNCKSYIVSRKRTAYSVRGLVHTVKCVHFKIYNEYRIPYMEWTTIYILYYQTYTSFAYRLHIVKYNRYSCIYIFCNLLFFIIIIILGNLISQ